MVKGIWNRIYVGALVIAVTAHIHLVESFIRLFEVGLSNTIESTSFTDLIGSIALCLGIFWYIGDCAIKLVKGLKKIWKEDEQEQLELESKKLEIVFSSDEPVSLVVSEDESTNHSDKYFGWSGNFKGKLKT